jgi:hypothetical protein
MNIIIPASTTAAHRYRDLWPRPINCECGWISGWLLHVIRRTTWSPRFYYRIKRCFVWTVTYFHAFHFHIVSRKKKSGKGLNETLPRTNQILFRGPTWTGEAARLQESIFEHFSVRSKKWESTFVSGLTDKRCAPKKKRQQRYDWVELKSQKKTLSNAWTGSSDSSGLGQNTPARPVPYAGRKPNVPHGHTTRLPGPPSFWSPHRSSRPRRANG